MKNEEMNGSLAVNEKAYRIVCLLGKGKGGYSYLAEQDGHPVVVKQIHHEPCNYYTFGNKIEAELRDYERLQKAGIRIPRMHAVDRDAERIVKDYIEGPTVMELVRSGGSVEPYLPQVRDMAAKAMAAGLNIDYYPTNFVVHDGLLWYVDYECNDYSEQWDFEHWGIQYWQPKVSFRSYRDGDYEAVCDFLIELNRMDRTHINWNWARFEWMMEHPEFDKNARSSIGLWWSDGKYTGGDVPEGMVVYEFPGSDWAVFTCIGPIPDALQSVNTQIFREWLPGNPEYELCGNASVEWYDCVNGEKTDPDYHSAIWVPVRRKE